MHIKIKWWHHKFFDASELNQTNFEIFISYEHLITYRCSLFTLKPLIHEICKYFGVFFTSLTDKENQWRLETTISNRCFPRYMISNVSCRFVHELKTSHLTSAPWIFCRLYLSIVYLSNLIKLKTPASGSWKCRKTMEDKNKCRNTSISGHHQHDNVWCQNSLQA